MELKQTATTYNPTLHQLLRVIPQASAHSSLLESVALAAPLAKPTLSYVLPPIAVKDVQEVKPVHVMAAPWQQGNIFSDIMILGALGAPTALHSLVITIQFAKMRESNKYF